MQLTQIYLSLGGNEEGALLRIRQAIELLGIQPKLFEVQFSHLYQTTPFEVTSSQLFVNAVCRFKTNLTPEKIFEITQKIECQLGKVSKPKNASRPIDIDILFYGHHRKHDHNLEIPHPRWKERLFVLIPLKDLTQEIVLQNPNGHEYYVIEELIKPLLLENSQKVSLLEKNPGIQ